MRWSTFVKRQPARPVSEDQVDVFEHGVAPTHRLTSPLHALQRGQLAPQSFGGILVRLPRRLSKIAARDAHGWVRGEPPSAVQDPPTRWGTRDEWERVYPGRGLGLPKPLLRRQTPRVPLTVYDLRQRVAQLEVEGKRPEPDGFFHLRLTAQELYDIREDTEYQRFAAGLLGSLPGLCVGQVHGIRLYLIPSVAEEFIAASRRLGEAVSAAFNEAARRRLLEFAGG